MTSAAQDLSKGMAKTIEMAGIFGVAWFLLNTMPRNRAMNMNVVHTTYAESSKTRPDWICIQSWLQNAALELDYLVWRVIATRTGGMPDDAPTLYKIASDLEEELLTEENIRRRLQELAGLANGWRTNETFPQF